MSQALPCYIITGILGAGKTTLLNHILNQPHGMKLGVVVNEFGSIDVDGQLVQKADGPQLNMANGCICCTIREDLEESLVKLLRENPELDGLVLEASGVADPQPIANTFILSETLRRLTRVDSVIAVVDLEAYPRLRGQNALLARRQVASSDLTLLNKIDLVSNEEVEAVKASLGNWVSGIRLLNCSQGHVPLDILLGQRRFRRAQLAPGPPVEVHLHQPGDHCHEHSHDQLVLHTWTFEEPGKFRARALATTLKTLPVGCYRAKGFVKLQEEDDEIFEVQLCGTRLDIREIELKPSRAEFLNQLVFLSEPGTINQTKLTNDLREALQESKGLSPSEELLRHVARVLGGDS